jgi:hypothetical protein
LDLETVTGKTVNANNCAELVVDEAAIKTRVCAERSIAGPSSASVKLESEVRDDESWAVV